RPAHGSDPPSLRGGRLARVHGHRAAVALRGRLRRTRPRPLLRQLHQDPRSDRVTTLARTPNRHARVVPRPRRDPVVVAPATPGITTIFIAIVVVLNVIGVVMVLSASSIVSLASYGSAWHVFERQLMWSAFGAVAFVIAFRVDYHRWQQWAVPLVVAAAILSLVVLVPGVGIMVSGSRRWLGMSWLRFQPSELAKLAVLLFAADLLSRRAADLWDW